MSCWRDVTLRRSSKIGRAAKKRRTGAKESRAMGGQQLSSLVESKVQKMKRRGGTGTKSCS